VILLLDTHALIWALEDSPRLSASARTMIEDGSNIVMTSAVSAWEISIKRSLGRLDAPDDLGAAIDAVGFSRRLITFADVDRLASLPDHHRDPFDRMLVAQALEDGAPIVSRDPEIAKYPLQVIW
jgi:PIN domain nuclease of toxin-antitoxin system